MYPLIAPVARSYLGGVCWVVAGLTIPGLLLLLVSWKARGTRLRRDCRFLGITLLTLAGLYFLVIPQRGLQSALRLRGMINWFNMHAFEEALEVFRNSHGTYPFWDGTRDLGHLGLKPPIGNDGLLQDPRTLTLLTTPTKYLFDGAKVTSDGEDIIAPEGVLAYVSWSDSFASATDPEPNLRYFAWVEEATDAEGGKCWIASAWMLCSRAPDRQWTLPPELVSQISLAALQRGENGILNSYLYDPTNGVLSKGDIIRTSWGY